MEKSYYIFAVNNILTIQLAIMSRTVLRKNSSYSEFRKQNSLSKTNLNHSLIDLDASISIIADEKTSELLSMEN